jgi:hypothetical protein
MLVVLIACAGQQQLKPAGPPPLPPPGPDCEATCHHQYKECANGSRCMMAPRCDMDVCIPEKADCLAHCGGGR